MLTTVISSLQVEGTHRWPDCPIPEVAFLRDEHRHMFHIKAEKEVTHDDRDVEIIMMKRSIESYLSAKYRNHSVDGQYCRFGSLSCEQIAKELVEQFDLIRCSVLEDGENGAAVYRDLE